MDLTTISPEPNPVPQSSSAPRPDHVSVFPEQRGDEGQQQILTPNGDDAEGYSSRSSSAARIGEPYTELTGRIIFETVLQSLLSR
jgi:hypothetical protein